MAPYNLTTPIRGGSVHLAVNPSASTNRTKSKKLSSSAVIYGYEVIFPIPPGQLLLPGVFVYFQIAVRIRTYPYFTTLLRGKDIHRAILVKQFTQLISIIIIEDLRDSVSI